MNVVNFNLSNGRSRWRHERSEFLILGMTKFGKIITMFLTYYMSNMIK
ncbi:hypothetical protein [Intestinibacter sp.]|nr:hypothetical protein [uncultured Intestinibacter sp.]